jgi:hypothetical protein
MAAGDLAVNTAQMQELIQQPIDFIDSSKFIFRKNSGKSDGDQQNQLSGSPKRDRIQFSKSQAWQAEDGISPQSSVSSANILP